MSREKYNIQFRIKAVDDFSKTMNRLHTRIESVKRHVDSLDDMKTVEISVSGDAKAKRDIKKVERAADKLDRKQVFIAIKSNWNESWKSFRGFMGKIANLSRDVSEIVSSMFGSAILAAAPALAGSLKAVTAVAGSLGPMIGVLAGGTLALATAFSAAGIAAAGFSALAFSSISKVLEANSELKTLREELANTTDEEERIKIMKEIENVTKSLSKEQQKALKSVQSLSKAWGDLVKKVEPQSIKVFTLALGALESIMKRLEPMLLDAADAAVELAESLVFNLDSDDFTAFIDFLNTSAVPIMKDVFKGIGNFTMGLINLMTAFGPLAETTAEGFRKMGEGFRDWAAGLSESEKFQEFVDYVQTEAPKLLKIFGGLILGLVDMFAAFAPFASHLLDRILDLVGGFREWASTLSDNESFQDFIEYAKSHGPKLLEFLGQLREFLFHVIEGFSKASEFVTPLITNMLKFANSILETNPWIMTLIGYLASFAGILMGVVVPLRLMWAALRMLLSPFKAIWGLIKPFVIPAFKWLWQKILIGIPFIARLGMTLLRFLTPVGAVASVVMTLAQIFGISWTDIANFTKEIWNKLPGWITEPLEKIWGTVKKFFGGIKDFITGSVSETSDEVSKELDEMSTNFESELSTMNSSVSNHLPNMNGEVSSNMADMAQYTRMNLGTMETNFSSSMGNIGSDVSNGFGDVDAMIDDYMGSMSETVSSDLSAIETDFSSYLGDIDTNIYESFSGMDMTVSEEMGSMSDAVSKGWGESNKSADKALTQMIKVANQQLKALTQAAKKNMLELRNTIKSMMQAALTYLRSISLFSIGSSMLQGLINGVNSRRSGLISAVRGAAYAAVRAAKAQLDINSPSRVFAKMGEFTGEGFIVGMTKMISGIKKAGERMVGASVVSTPEFQGVNTAHAPNYGGSTGAKNSGTDNGLLAEILGELRNQRETIVRIESDNESIRAYVNERNAIEDALYKF